MTRARSRADAFTTLIGGTEGHTFQASDSTTTLGAYAAVDFSTGGTPTVTGGSPSTIDNNSNAVTVSGTNFVAGILVHAQNADGDVFVPTAISLTNATTVVATFDIDTDGTYFIRVENTDGFAGISSSAILTVS